MTKMEEYAVLVVRLEAAANMVLEHGLGHETRLELKESSKSLAKWVKENLA